MLFHTNPNVKSICQRVGVANICFSTGFACEARKRGDGNHEGISGKKQNRAKRGKLMPV